MKIGFGAIGKGFAANKDLHTYGHFEYNFERPESNSAYSLAAGLSTEFDYNSFSVG